VFREYLLTLEFTSVAKDVKTSVCARAAKRRMMAAHSGGAPVDYYICHELVIFGQ